VGLLEVTCPDRHRSIGPGEAPGQSEPDSPVAAGDDADVSGQIEEFHFGEPRGQPPTAAARPRAAPVQSSRRAVWDKTGIRAAPSAPDEIVRLGPMANGARKAASPVRRGVTPAMAATATTRNAP